ncbi:amidase [Marchantia polymorpha subsp. ruderalis]|uniref:Glutamyl-tRNA(Gln) amidotransferase subunit A, chloroplastic/mitochondrial n=2 Tax=Marchantia polymorpha TaxID=3197 RepID=A0AAF6AKG4_MARPO|nr:hypothetical protein MARPO_0029s0077 [Marchantia polymorpha]BBM96934.1 hypothetical protein Mp_1g01690 [Marchantia polymorpha subsp. ruderalis]|eukprot:PTQ42548.1 hypothetical protein MARPO_0029s0077 [Marchantia polymorpha]
MAFRTSALMLPHQVGSGVNWRGQALKLSSKATWAVRSSSSCPSGTVTVGYAQAQERPSSVIRKIREDLENRERSAVNVMEDYLVRLRDREPQVQSFLHISEKALEEAKLLDEKIAQKATIGPLAGVPIAVKDNLCTKDMPSTGGSKILEGYRPPYDATAVRKLREGGAIIVGKTNMDEFGMGSTTEGSAYKVTANPWDVSRVPGGSSGGSAAAVAARQCAGALGSDTGGSIRQPASFCGVVGLKPTYGRVSRSGLMAYASSLDVVGCFGSSVEDVAILLQSIAGHDNSDSTSSTKDVPSFVETLKPVQNFSSKPLAGVKFGLIKETLEDGVDSSVVFAIRSAAQHLESLGAEVIEVELPKFSLGLPAYYVLAASEASSNLSRYDGARYGNRADAQELIPMYGNSRAQGLGAEVKRRILMGTYALSAGYYDAFYKRAQQVRRIIQTDLEVVLSKVDVLLSPVAPTVAYKIGEKTDDPLSMYAGDLMTVNVNLAGLPALVLPCGLAEGGPCGLPVGLQMVGKSFDEGELLRLGHIFEQTAPHWCQNVPPLVQ